MSIITPDQSRAARRELGISQADVSSALHLNRQYLSEFENGHTSRLTSNQLRKLRSFYKEKIEEAVTNGDEIDLTFGNEQTEKPASPELETFAARRINLSVTDDLPLSVLGKTMDMVQDNDARLATLLQQQVGKDDTLLGEGDFTDETVEAMQEIFGLLALNYVLYRLLSGWPAMKIEPSAESPETLRDLIFSTYSEQLVASGLLSKAPETDVEVV